MGTIRKLLHPAAMLLCGLAIGAAVRLLDIYTVTLGEIFSRMAVWILLGTLIAIYSPTPKRAMANIGDAGGLLCRGRHHPRGVRGEL